MTEVWIDIFSLDNWCDQEMWEVFVVSVEKIFGTRALKLDTSDPAKRACSRTGRGEFIVAAIDPERTRSVFCRFENGIEVDIAITGGNQLRPSNCLISIPAPASRNSARIAELFNATINTLPSFYGYTDYKEVVVRKKPSPPTLSVHFEYELMGVFWMTFFGHDYSLFFKDKLPLLHEFSLAPTAGGILIKLAERIDEVGIEARARCEEELGVLVFASNGQTITKDRGQHVLLYERLKPVS